MAILFQIMKSNALFLLGLVSASNKSPAVYGQQTPEGDFLTVDLSLLNLISQFSVVCCIFVNLYFE